MVQIYGVIKLFDYKTRQYKSLKWLTSNYRLVNNKAENYHEEALNDKVQKCQNIGSRCKCFQKSFEKSLFAKHKSDKFGQISPRF